MTGIIISACLAGIALYCAMGLSGYWFFSLLMTDEPYDRRDAIRVMLTWPTMLFG
jgi:hypothetical protein